LFLQEQALRDNVSDDLTSVKARAKETFLALQRAEKEEADANNLKRHLKEQLEIITAEDQEKKEVALKADAIAQRMAEMAAKADGAWQEVSKAKAKTAAGFAEAKATAKATASAESRAEKQNSAAEDKAQAASAKLAVADKQVQSLLQVCVCLCLSVGHPSRVSAREIAADACSILRWAARKGDAGSIPRVDDISGQRSGPGARS
jgi:hypothetical protein